MKKSIILIGILIAGVSLQAQNAKTVDEIILKDNTIIHGQIIQNVIDDYISIKTANGEFKVLKYTAIQQISRKELKINTKEYGGTVSIGTHIGGGSLWGVPIRVYPTEKVALELSMGIRPIIDMSGSNDFSMNFFTGGDINVFFSKKYNEKKNRMQMNGLFAKLGGSFGKQYKELMFACGWVYEMVKDKNKSKSLNFELGIGFSRLQDKGYAAEGDYYYSSSSESGRTISPMIYWKIGWNFFVAK